MNNNIIAIIPEDNSNNQIWNNLLNNNNLLAKLEENDIYIYLCNEYNIKKTSNRIKIIDDDSYKKASLLITDYNKLDKYFIDEIKPVIYYQKNIKNNFDYKNVCGKVLSSEEDVINRIIGYINMNFRLEKIYQKRINKLDNATNYTYNLVSEN